MARYHGRGPTPAWEREFNLRLGRKIVAAREAQGMNAKDLARRLGVDAARLWHWEHGSYRIGVARLQLIADALGVTATSLIPPLYDLNPGRRWPATAAD
jgi:transcriptional regulator with XRE-family HTH domain